MKIIFLFVVLTLVSTLNAQAAGGIIELNGWITQATDPNGHCGASNFGYVITGSYTDNNGQQQALTTCLESIALPLRSNVKIDFSNQLLRDANQVLKMASGKPATLTLAVTDLENTYEATLLKIDVENKK